MPRTLLTLGFGLALALQLSCTAGPAAAQRTGSRIGHDAESGNVQDAASASETIANCVAGRRPEFVRRLLALLPGTKEEFALVHAEEGDLSICMEDPLLVMDGKELRVRPRALRLPVARAMIRRMLPRAPAQSPLPSESDPWFLPGLTSLPTGAAIDRSALGFQDFGHCVAVHSWPATLALLASEPDSTAQAAAVRRLLPVLGPCLSDDVKITITGANLRDVLAEPVYHILAGAPSPRAKP
jgi:hypothetical protein